MIWWLEYPPPSPNLWHCPSPIQTCPQQHHLSGQVTGALLKYNVLLERTDTDLSTTSPLWHILLLLGRPQSFLWLLTHLHSSPPILTQPLFSYDYNSWQVIASDRFRTLLSCCLRHFHHLFFNTGYSNTAHPIILFLSCSPIHSLSTIHKNIPQNIGHCFPHDQHTLLLLL